MKQIKVAFFDAKEYDREFFDRANKNYGFKIKYFSERLNKDTAEMAAGFDAVCAFVNDSVDKTAVEKLKKSGTGLVALRSAGYNNVDLKAAFGKVHLVRVPAYSPGAVAEHTVALMLSLNRKIHKAYYRTRDNNFSIHGFIGFDMKGKTAGVIGTGKIGREVAGILSGFGMKILAYDKHPDEGFKAEKKGVYTTLDRLYRESDIITLHCPLNKDTYHLIGGRAISRMKKGVMLINTGRGSLIDAKALIKGLKTGKIGYAGLDVYEEEDKYFFEDFSGRVMGDDVLARLLTFGNVLITSHQGFFTAEALQNIARTTMENIKKYFEKGKLENEICYKCTTDECNKKRKGRCF